MADFDLRLNKFVKEGIASRAAGASFEREAEKLLKAEQRLAQRAYDAIIPRAEQRAAAKMPAHWFQFVNALHLNVTGRRIYLMLSEQKPVPYRAKETGSCGGHGVIGQGKLAEEIDALLAAKDDLKKRREQAKNAVTQLLSTIATMKQLIKLWPEGRPFYKHLEEIRQPTAPMIPVAEVNGMLGIGKAARIAA